MLQYSTLSLSLALALSVTAQAAEKTMQPMVIIGDTEDARALAGSAAVVDNPQIQREATSDINQLLKTVPGVYIREEDGAGLRPNIGIRGASGERSQKITLLEDGVMIAPAPYSAPAAYYFPTALRMHSLEVLKGAPLLRYGPQTTGGVLNMVSTPIPPQNGGKARFMLGEHGSSDIHSQYGGHAGQWSWLLEAVERNSNGFKNIDRSNRDSGFTISDYLAKLRWQSASGPQQSVLFKIQRSQEVSNETYLGLSDADFTSDSQRRYGLSSIDQMNNDHTGISLNYRRELSDSLSASATLYRHEFARNWFKLSGGGSLIDAANNGDANAQGILNGSIDTTDLSYKHNNREYLSQGLELTLDIATGAHLFTVGGRIHQDETDRFQPSDVYDQVNGSLRYRSTTAPSSSNNRVETADAIAVWLKDDWQLSERLNVNLALRYEDVDTEQRRYGDNARTTVANRRSNNSSEILPGASFTYELNSDWQMLGGIHKGFSPLGGGASSNQQPETSINYEFGARYNAQPGFIEAIGFYSQLDNASERCSVGTPCSNGNTSGSYVTGESDILGLEFQAGNQFTAGRFTIPVNLAYTYTQAEASADKTSEGIVSGDRLKDIPEHIFSARLGLEHNSGWNNYAVLKYIDDSCVSIGCERTGGGKTEALTVIDYISRYQLKGSDTELFLKVENVFDQQKIISRTPDGARPNKPRTLSIGTEISF